MLFTGEHVEERQPPTGDERPAHFAVHLRLAGDVHRGVLGPRDGELGVLARQRRGISDADLDEVVEPAAAVEIGGDRAELRCHVDADELAAEVRGQRACRPADAAADVEHDVVGSDPGGRGEAERRRQPERVEVIDRGEHVGGEVVDVVPLGRHRVEDPREHGTVARLLPSDRRRHARGTVTPPAPRVALLLRSQGERRRGRPHGPPVFVVLGA